MISPENYTNTTTPTPVRLEWTIPDAGQSCLSDTDNSSLVFSIFASQSYPPEFLASTNANYSEMNVLSPGLWFWTVSASNSYFFTPVPEIRSFMVESGTICFSPYQVCNPMSPMAPDQIYPPNGEYISDIQFSLTFVGSGSFGISCSPQIGCSHYRVCIVFM